MYGKTNARMTNDLPAITQLGNIQGTVMLDQEKHTVQPASLGEHGAGGER